jgi:hypothetical protein
MAGTGELLRELAALEEVQQALASVAARTDDQRRHDLIELRRRLAAQIATIGQIAEPMLQAHGEPRVLQEYRSKFSAMRSAAAMHQASWPAVRLGENPIEYNRSAAGVREANRQFLMWLRATLSTIERR